MTSLQNLISRFQKYQAGNKSVILPLQSNMSRESNLNARIKDQEISTCSVQELTVNDEEQVEGSESSESKTIQVCLPSEDMPSLYWDELAPPWLKRHIKQQNKDKETKSLWVFPTNRRLPVESVQNPERIEEIVECTAVLETPVVVPSENHSNSLKPSTHLHKYLTWMYFFCTAPARCNMKRSSESHQNWSEVLFQFLHKVLFCLVVSSAVFDTACQAKFHMLLFFAGEGFNQLVKFTFSMVTIATALYGAHLLSQEPKFGNMLDIMSEYESNDEYETQMPYVTTISALTTAIMAFIQPVFYYGVWEHSATEVVYLSSYELGQDLYIWDWKSINSTDYRIFDLFTEPNVVNFLLGSVKMSRDFFFNLLMGMLWDLVSTIAVVLYCWKQCFVGKHLMRVRDIVSGLNSDEAVHLQAERELVWKKAPIYADAFRSVNQVFCQFLPFFHVRHVLTCAYFLSICILPDENTTAIVYLFYLYTIVKAETMYIISAKIDEQNDMHRKFLRNWGLHNGKVTVDGEDYDFQALLGELETDPLVFGSGSFAINQRFHFGLLGLVSSLFVSLANGIGKVSAA